MRNVICSRWNGLLLALLGGLLFATPVLAQDFPTRPIRIVVGFSAGGATDLTARILADMAQEHLGQPIIVENRTGGGGALAVAFVATSPADGYTLAAITASPVTLHPHVQELPYDPMTDLQYIVQVATYNHPISVRADAPWDTLEELLDYARENPGTLRHSTGGQVVQQPNIAVEQLRLAEGLSWITVPYEGGAPAMTALLGGHVDFSSSAEYREPLRAGQIKLLAETGDAKIPDYEDIRTFPELGYDFNSVAFIGLAAPAGIPDDVLERLVDAFTQVVQDPEFAERAGRIGILQDYKTADDFATYIMAGYEATGIVLRELGEID